MEVSKGRGGKEGGWGRKRWKPIWSRTTCPGKLQIAKGLTPGEYVVVVIDLPNLGIQFINIIIGLCAFLHGLLGLEIYCNKFAPMVWLRTQLT